MIDIFSYKLGQKRGGGSGGGGGGGGGSNEEWIGDGNTHLWISLPEGRTSPRLGAYVNGTLTVDWGDGTEPDVLTGTSTASNLVYTPNHAYAKAGDYVITLTVEGAFIFGQFGAVVADAAYKNAVLKMEIANGATRIHAQTLKGFPSLRNVFIPDTVTKIEAGAFYGCYALVDLVIPDSVTSFGVEPFWYCGSLTNIVIPDGVTDITSRAFSDCKTLRNIVIPNSVTSIGPYAFNNCSALTSIAIPDGVTSIGSYAFYYCSSLTSVVIPNGVTTINAYTFCSCGSAVYFDFSNHTSVPTLANTNAFNGITVDCKIRVPAALVDEWKAATNWSTYAGKIVGV